MADVFVPTHRVPAGGLPAWDAPDPARTAVATLDPGLDVRCVEQRDDGWTRIVCSNDWIAWVDGRRLMTLGSADGIDAEVFPVLERALHEYAQVLDDFTNQRIDADAFRRKTFEVGLVVRDTDAWILEVPTGRWWRYDGTRLTTIEMPDGDAVPGPGGAR